MIIDQPSEQSLLILFDQSIDEVTANKVIQLNRLIETHLKELIIDLIPAYNSIFILFDLTKISGSALTQKINRLSENNNETSKNVFSSQTIEIPVYYDLEVGPDLSLIADNTRLSIAEVIELHSQRTYQVYAMGFSPGFAYLGNVDQRIATPRKATPRQKVYKGSIGIANEQTAVYPSDSPGGWQIIGRTPLSLFDYAAPELTQIKIADKVRFTPITRNEFIQLGGHLECH